MAEFEMAAMELSRGEIDYDKIPQFMKKADRNGDGMLNRDEF
jgi:hypothetical protein